jgi:hypothetical protein
MAAGAGDRDLAAGLLCTPAGREAGCGAAPGTCAAIATNPKVKTCAGIPHFFAAPDILSGIFRYFFEVTGIFLKCPIYFRAKVDRVIQDYSLIRNLALAGLAYAC